MNNTRFIVCLAIAVTSCIIAATAAQLAAPAGYDLSWHTIDGGGGTSTGGNFAVSGTIGQPDADPAVLSGGGFEVRGGFWAGGVTPAPTCPWDIALPPNGMIDIDDLVLVITHWGATGNDVADITNDNIVNIDDLVQIIIHWGMCP